MIIYEEKPTTVLEFTKFICDRCSKEITWDVELQETYSIRFVGGYLSVFGDMASVECDLCQECLNELIGGFCRINGF